MTRMRVSSNQSLSKTIRLQRKVANAVRTKMLDAIMKRASNMNDRMMQEWGRIERMKSDIDLALKEPGLKLDYEAGAIIQEALSSAQKAIDNVQTALGEATYPHDPTTRAKYVS